VGNPQNMLCAVLGDLSYAEHLRLIVPLAALCLGVNHGFLWLFFHELLEGKSLRAPAEPAPMLRPRTTVTLGIIAGTAVAYLLGADLAWAAAAGFVALMLLHRRDTRQLWVRIDWSLLLFFAGLFVVVEGFMQSGGPDWLFAHFPLAEAGTDGLAGSAQLSGIFLVGSNLVSNVPFILVVHDQMATLTDPTKGWELLAVVSTFAGNLTLLGSVANIIVAECARDIGGIGFVDYLKVGVPLTLVTTGLAVVWFVLFF